MVMELVCNFWFTKESYMRTKNVAVKLLLPVDFSDKAKRRVLYIHNETSRV